MDRIEQSIRAGEQTCLPTRSQCTFYIFESVVGEDLLDKVRDLLPLVGPILSMLGLGEHAGKASDAAKVLREILDLTDGR